PAVAPARVAAPPAVAPATARPDYLAAFEAWRVGADAIDSAWGTPIAPGGAAAANLMVLVDMPEREDAQSGHLLGGDVGRLFDRMLAAIGRDRASIYLASLAVARPVTGQIAAEFHDPLTRLVRHHIALVRPRRLLLLGNAVSRAVLGANAAAARGRFHVLNYEGGTTEAVASYHPRFLLERPACKAEAWRDLQMLIGGLEV
ncbi:MAG: uracil-DNA glycosylase family protein, partial [Sphingomonas sp.]